MPTKTTLVTDSVTSSTEQVVFTRFELKVTQGPDAGLAKTFGQPVVHVGTARANDLVLTDRAVSRFHLRIETRGGSFSLIDMGSTNGTFLGRYRVEVAHLHGETALGIGGTTLQFRPLAAHATVNVPRVDRFGPLIGQSPQMRQLYAVIERAAAADIPVIIEGETGTGKELVARLLHDHSTRVAGPFEVLDCTSVPDNLLESEVFGHVRGAFTGAERDRQGIFERANGGTVFIDEIGEIKLELQPKLLRVLETGQVRKVGDNSFAAVSVRVVAATHRSLSGLVNQGQFREDLYYRLAGCKIELPPLRERTEDIPLLVDHFLSQLRQQGRRDLPAALDQATIQEFVRNPWPGNVRQLKNAVAHAATMGRRHALPDEQTAAFSAGTAVADTKQPLKNAKDEFERRYLTALLVEHDGDLNAAAQAAGLHPKSLARLLRRYSLTRR